MAQMNSAYGSELHLLRMLGRHRKVFDERVLEVTKADAVTWLDFPCTELSFDERRQPRWDREWQQLDFLQHTDKARIGWPAVWPAGKQGQSWDAVGQVRYGESQEWLLVEAKANVQELHSDCGAKNAESRNLIERALATTKKALEAREKSNWLVGYYQFCNRLTVLNHLNRCGTPARLLFIYFTGDIGGGGRMCPAHVEDWEDALRVQSEHVGLPQGHPLDSRIHKLFVPLRGATPSPIAVPAKGANG